MSTASTSKSFSKTMESARPLSIVEISILESRKAELESQKRITDDLKQKLAELNQIINNLKREYDRLEGKLLVAEAKNNRLEAGKDKLPRPVTELQRRLKKKDREIKSLEDEILKLKHAAAGSLSENKELKAENLMLGGELGQNHREYQYRIGQLKSEKESLTISNTEIKGKLSLAKQNTTPAKELQDQVRLIERNNTKCCQENAALRATARISRPLAKESIEDTAELLQELITAGKELDRPEPEAIVREIIAQNEENETDNVSKTSTDLQQNPAGHDNQITGCLDHYLRLPGRVTNVEKQFESTVAIQAELNKTKEALQKSEAAKGALHEWIAKQKEQIRRLIQQKKIEVGKRSSAEKKAESKKRKRNVEIDE